MRFLTILLLVASLSGQSNTHTNDVPAVNFSFYQAGTYPNLVLNQKSAILGYSYFNYLLDQAALVAPLRSNEAALTTSLADSRKKTSLLEDVTNSQGQRLFYKDQQISYLTNALDTTVKYGQVEKTLKTSPVLWFFIGAASAFILYEVGKNIAFPIVILTNR